MSSNKKKGFSEYEFLNGMVAVMLLALFLLPGIYMYQQFVIPLQEQQAREEAARLASNQEKLEKLKAELERNRVEDGIHVATGLIADDNYQLVVSNCTSCHSPKLITQNRATKEGWTKMIKWMQETQNLWDLGENEELIVEYLAKNYAPEFKGRRAALTNVEWYELSD
jgi:nitrate reductase cytochrome c-type subunit